MKQRHKNLSLLALFAAVSLALSCSLAAKPTGSEGSQAISLAADSPSMKGIYKMDLKIGDNQFLDILVIDKAPANNKSGEISGTLTVPAVFTTKTSGTIESYLYSSSAKATFEINIDEGRGMQNFKYTIDLSHCYIFPGVVCNNFTGELHNNGKEIGQFTAVRLVEAITKQ